MNNKVSSVPTEISPEMAADLLKRYPYKHQRSVRRNAVEFYACEMEKGNFKPYTTIELCRCGTSKHLIDGQHRLLAVVASKTPQKFVLLETEVDDEQELAFRYATTDRGAIRTTTDQLATTFDPDGLWGFSKSITIVAAFGSAVQFISGKFIHARNTGVSLPDKLNRMNAYAPFAEYFFEVIDNCADKTPPDLVPRVRRSATLSVALITYRYSVGKLGLNKVDDFWTGVLTDDSLQSHDPRKHAHRHLLTVGMNGGAWTRSVSKSSAIVSTASSARYLANCFNAYMGAPSKWKAKGNYYPTYQTEAIKIAGWDGKE